MLRENKIMQAVEQYARINKALLKIKPLDISEWKFMMLQR